MNLANTWNLYFEQLETNDVSNSSLELFATATIVHDDFQAMEAIRSLTEDDDVVIMTVAPVTKNIKFFHSPSNLGGTRVRPENKIVAMDGFGTTARPVQLDEACLTATVDLRTPSGNSLKNLKSVEDIRTSTGPTSGRKNFQHLTFVILPPFLSNVIVTKETREPEEILVQCQELIKLHDEAHVDVTGFKKAADECKNILSFLWSATKGLIPSTIFVTGDDDPDTDKWGKRRHNNCITTQSQNLPNNNGSGFNDEIIQSLTHSIDNQTVLFESLRQEKQDEKEEKSNKYSDLHDSTKRLILNASSIDGESIPTEPIITCLNFFNKKNISKALDFLESSLSQDLKCCATVETGLVTALYNGHFLRDRDDSPSNFSFFMIPKKLPLSADKTKPTMILQLKASQGKGWSETDLKEALKQGRVTPLDIHTLGHQLKNFGAWHLSFSAKTPSYHNPWNRYYNKFLNTP